MIEISNGTEEGWWSSIASSDAVLNTITITSPNTFPAGLAADVNVTVRKFNTIQDVFGDNSPGLAPFSAEVPYDEIQFLQPDIQEVGVIVWADAWVNLATEELADTDIIYPGTSVKVIHRANTSLSVVASGEVKTTKTQIDVFEDDNWVSQPNPIEETFGTLTLGPQILETDTVDIIQPDAGLGQETTTYVSSGGVMYNLATEDDATPVPVASGTGYLNRRSTGAASVLTIPAQSVGP